MVEPDGVILQGDPVTAKLEADRKRERIILLKAETLTRNLQFHHPDPLGNDAGCFHSGVEIRLPGKTCLLPVDVFRRIVDVSVRRHCQIDAVKLLFFHLRIGTNEQAKEVSFGDLHWIVTGIRK